MEKRGQTCHFPFSPEKREMTRLAPFFISDFHLPSMPTAESRLLQND